MTNVSDLKEGLLDKIDAKTILQTYGEFMLDANTIKSSLYHSLVANDYKRKWLD